MKCIFCKNAKQDRKTKTIFNKRRNLHGSDIWRAKNNTTINPFRNHYTILQNTPNLLSLTTDF